MKSTIPQQIRRNASATNRRSKATFRLQMAMEEERRHEIAERLRYLRQSRGLKRKHIADALDVSLRAVDGYLGGEHGIDLDKLDKLADIMRTTPNFILNGGPDAGPSAPDLMGNLNSDNIQLVDLANELAQVKAAVSQLASDVLAELEELDARLQSLQSERDVPTSQRQRRQ